MMRLVDKTIESCQLRIDGKHFVHCRFVNVELIYWADDDVDFEDCTFENCSWTFDEAAERMIGLLSTLQERVSGGPELVEGIFNSIRNKKVETIRQSVRLELAGTVRGHATVRGELATTHVTDNPKTHD